MRCLENEGQGAREYGSVGGFESRDGVGGGAGAASAPVFESFGEVELQ